MLCEICKKNVATVKVVKSVNGNTSQLNICLECANINVNDMQEQISENDIARIDKALKDADIKNVIQKINEAMNKHENGKVKESEVSEEDTIVCSGCHQTYVDFINTAILGCPECYKAFDHKFREVLKDFSNGGVNIGKIPKSADEIIKNKRELEFAKVKLSRAIENEDYETASKYRDIINTLKIQIKFDIDKNFGNDGMYQ